MKKIGKYLLITLGAVLGLALLFGAIIGLKPLPNYDEAFPLTDLEVELSSDRIQTGAQISSVLCNHCHGDKGSLQGKLFEPNSDFGKIYAPNITQDPNEGIADYTDAELYRLLRTGVLKSGRLALPMMMRFPQAADEEIYSIIAFLRSGNKAVQPSDNKVPDYEANFLAKMLFTMVFQPMALQETPKMRPSRTSETYGHYLANSLYACYDCHSASFESNDFITPENSIGFYGGGTPIAIGNMEPVVSTNITGNKDEGIGNWTADEFLTTLKYGKKPDNTPLKYPMLPYNFMDSTDIYAIHAYLLTVPQPAQGEL